jgi:hypothetical protein
VSFGKVNDMIHWGRDENICSNANGLNLRLTWAKPREEQRGFASPER